MNPLELQLLILASGATPSGASFPGAVPAADRTVTERQAPSAQIKIQA
jgi:hypothetical protein